MQASHGSPPGRPVGTAHRGLSTARAALQVVWLLAGHPEGVRADEVAEALGKSVSTAYNLLTSLCEEAVAVHHAGGRYRLAPAFRDVVAESAGAPSERPDLSAVVDELLVRTHKRAYLGVVSSGHLHVIQERGHQGMARMPGLDPEIRDNAHALALGKVVLALAPPRAVTRYLSSGLRTFTPHTVTRPDVLLAEFGAIRRTGIAVDREEFREDFCSLAAPILGEPGRFLAVVGISMTRRAFETERDELEASLREVVRMAGGRSNPGHRFQACDERREVLDPRGEADLLSATGSTTR
jgi:DNA-binding IclR family transcriptional regulator